MERGTVVVLIITWLLIEDKTTEFDGIL